MSHAVCTKQCYYAEREFLVGEILEVGEGEIPAHFKAATEHDSRDKRVYEGKPQPKKPTPAIDRAKAGEPVAFSELL